MSNGNSKITEPLNPHPENEKSEFIVKKRDQWSSKLEFILSCVGYAIGMLCICMNKIVLNLNYFFVVPRLRECLEVYKI